MALNSYVLKVLVEKQTNRVALAESGADFVLLLLRLFALPLSTIVKLVGKQAPIGCLSQLYESVETLEAEQFNTEACKTMLLRPKCVSRAAARDLKVNIEETSFFVCEKPTCSLERYRTISTIMGAICLCGGVMNTLIESKISKDGSTDLKEIEKVFANETCRFMISDDLKVRAISTFEGFSFLDDLGIRDAKHLEERTVKIGTYQVVHLVKRVLLSKTPLTDMIFPKEVDKDGSDNSQHHISTVFEKAADNDSNKIPVKLVISKFNRMVLYAEANEKFVDILFSFLTFPLGSALHFLDGNSSMGGGCVDNLYKSMGNMTENKLLTSHAEELLKPNLPPHFSCLNQPLNLQEDFHQCQYYYAMKCMDSKCWGPTHQVISDNVEFKCSHGVSKLLLVARDPKSRSHVRSESGFVKGPTTFMITDELEVSPLSFFSALSFLSRFNLKRGDVEELIVQVGTPEVISLLRASISSNQALNHAFNVRKEDDIHGEPVGKLEQLD